mgnify:CR=1 FL=1
MKINYLNEYQINEYQNEGVIILRGLFDNWIEKLQSGFEKVLNSPSEHARENVNEHNNGSFFEDYCNWQRIPEFKDFILNSPAAKIVAEATKSSSVQIFHDHIFSKDPGTTKETPWHQDLPYYCLDGNDTGSLWIPLENVSKENSLKVLKKSHKLDKLVKPTKWSTNISWYKNNNNFIEISSINENDKNIFNEELIKGDAILFNFKSLHYSPGNKENKPRKAFSVRLIGDDVRYIDRGEETSPPYKDINLQNGQKLRKDWFPVIWSN